MAKKTLPAYKVNEKSKTVELYKVPNALEQSVINAYVANGYSIVEAKRERTTAQKKNDSKNALNKDAILEKITDDKQKALFNAICKGKMSDYCGFIYARLWFNQGMKTNRSGYPQIIINKGKDDEKTITVKVK